MHFFCRGTSTRNTLLIRVSRVCVVLKNDRPLLLLQGMVCCTPDDGDSRADNSTTACGACCLLSHGTAALYAEQEIHR